MAKGRCASTGPLLVTRRCGQRRRRPRRSGLPLRASALPCPCLWPSSFRLPSPSSGQLPSSGQPTCSPDPGWQAERLSALAVLRVPRPAGRPAEAAMVSQPAVCAGRLCPVARPCRVAPAAVPLALAERPPVPGRPSSAARLVAALAPLPVATVHAGCPCRVDQPVRAAPADVPPARAEWPSARAQLVQEPVAQARRPVAMVRAAGCPCRVDRLARVAPEDVPRARAGWLSVRRLAPSRGTSDRRIFHAHQPVPAPAADASSAERLSPRSP